MKNEIVFLSVVDSGFIEGFLTMIFSLYDNNPDIRHNKYIIINAGLTETDILRIKKNVPNAEFRKVIFPKLRNSRHLKRLESAYLKFDAYDNKNYHRLVVLDCDMLVIKPIDIDAILNTPDHTISACYGQLAGKGLMTYLNSGFVIIPKGINKKEELIRNVNIKNSQLADQGSINNTFKNFNPFDKSHNVEKRIVNEKDYKLADARIIHYVGDVKPWHHPKKREPIYLRVYSIWDKYNKRLKDYENK